MSGYRLALWIKLSNCSLSSGLGGGGAGLLFIWTKGENEAVRSRSCYFPYLYKYNLDIILCYVKYAYHISVGRSLSRISQQCTQSWKWQQ